MVKPSKRRGRGSGDGGNPKLSAFAVYKECTRNQATTVELPDANGGQHTTSNENPAPVSTGIMKHISNRAFPFRRSLKKKAKRQKKNMEVPLVEEDAPVLKVRRLPLSVGNSSKKTISLSSGKGQQHFGSSDRLIPKQDNAFHLTDGRKALHNIKMTSQLQYKSSDRSVELSTSHSLTGFEDDFDECMNEGLPVFDENLDPNSNKVDSVKTDNRMKLFKMDHVDAAFLTNSEEIKNGSSGTSTTQPNSNVDIPSSAPISVRKAVGKVSKMPLPTGNSEEDSKVLFKWLIHPMSEKHFLSSIWEKKPALIKRRVAMYANGFFGTEDFNKMLHESDVQYGVNLDVTSFQNGIRETHNPEGRVYPAVAWDYFKNGCSLRVKNPQAFSKPIWRLCATLQEYFKNMVGSNIYLTPPGTQGFAPHYDDIEAFVLQLEGRKHWRLYNPRSMAETLPRYSSGNLIEDDIGDQIFDAVLQPGDLLYFPRGFIHQAQAIPDCHSLHITISTYQKNTWADALEDMLPKALQKAISEDLDFRKGLPIDYTKCMGYQNKEYANHGRRRQIISKAADLIRKIADYIDVDENADERAKVFLHDALPPVLTQGEISRCIEGATVQLSKTGVPSCCQCDIDLSTEVRIIRKNALRIVRSEDYSDDEDYYVYHCIQNPRTYHTQEQKFFAITHECVPTIEYLIQSYPGYVSVRSIPLSSDEAKVNVISDLLEKGVLLTKSKLRLIDRM